MKDKTVIENIKDLISHLGEDTEREGLVKTPERFFKAMKELTQGYSIDASDLINGAMFASNMDELIIVKDIEFYSLCEHHLLPFMGKCHVCYLPQGKVIGLSKIPRIVNMFAHRMQIQERLTEEIALCIEKHTNAQGVGVIIEAQHMCMVMRGVQKQNAYMTTSKMIGQLKNDAKSRSEFLSLIR